ncbi:MAG: M28 family peptidase [Anaerolineaceae bacterium]
MRIVINTKLNKLITFFILLLSLIILLAYFKNQQKVTSNQYKFDGEKALEGIEYQVNLGSRVTGSSAHAEVINWIVEELNTNNWEAEINSSENNGILIKNIVGKKGNGKPWIIIGAQYDSRMYADQDKEPSNRNLPVPGANDGASGVAILLELSRLIDNDFMQKSWAKEIWLVFFDAEDNGNIPGWDWIMGSDSFAENLQETPNLVVILDMVGDADLNIFMESNSNRMYTEEIWRAAADLGYDNYFIPEIKYNIIDDHIPFIHKGIPAIDIIDFDYPYWHTTADTLDKVSAESMMIVGNTLISWLTNAQHPQE